MRVSRLRCYFCNKVFGSDMNECPFCGGGIDWAEEVFVGGSRYEEPLTPYFVDGGNIYKPTYDRYDPVVVLT